MAGVCKPTGQSPNITSAHEKSPSAGQIENGGGMNSRNWGGCQGWVTRQRDSQCSTPNSPAEGLWAGGNLKQIVCQEKLF